VRGIGTLAGGGPRRFRVLAAAQACSGIASVPFAVWDNDAVAMREAQTALAVAWLILAALTWCAAPRLGPWAYVASLLVSGLLVSASAAISLRGQIQVLEGLGILVLGIVAAYHVRGRTYHLYLCAICVMYALALVLNPLLIGIWVGVVVILVVIGVCELTYVHLEELRASLLHDPLTGALNRKGLAERAPAVRALAQRAERETCVAMVDLDRFKAYNDAHGHRAGDELLVGIVRTWNAALRASDLVARTGGDEFVLVLPGSSPRDAAATLERLRGISPAPWTAGVVPWRDDEDVLEAVDRADVLMYRAKAPREP
jgi:diguanylate cyclase (GGDEF)-like protein